MAQRSGSACRRIRLSTHLRLRPNSSVIALAVLSASCGSRTCSTLAWRRRYSPPWYPHSRPQPSLAHEAGAPGSLFASRSSRTQNRVPTDGLAEACQQPLGGTSTGTTTQLADDLAQPRCPARPRTGDFGYGTRERPPVAGMVQALESGHRQLDRHQGGASLPAAMFRCLDDALQT